MSTTVGDADIAGIAELVADPGRARILLALGDGRALAASTLATEAGVAASTASSHLAKLTSGGLLAVERHGRHRYYRLADPKVGELLESLARIAPAAPVRSLRQGTRAHAVRVARTCYDHLAGRLGTAVMAALLDEGILSGGDGIFRADGRDRLSSPGRGDVTYSLTDFGRRRLDGFGVSVSSRSRRPLVRYCVDWSEQRHHLAGALGAAILDRFVDLAWVRRPRVGRAVYLTNAGRQGLVDEFAVAIPDDE
ncbi:MAG: ArsR/SmtB family transcription factor [Terriglobales bacterium]